MSWHDYEADRIVHVTHLPRELPAVADLTRQRDDLTAHVARLEAENCQLRREWVRMRSQLAPTPRKAPRWWIPLAWLGIAWGGYTSTYAYELKEADDGQATDRD